MGFDMSLKQLVAPLRQLSLRAIRFDINLRQSPCLKTTSNCSRIDGFRQRRLANFLRLSRSPSMI
jgi:hypothetical protein